MPEPPSVNLHPNQRELAGAQARQQEAEHARQLLQLDVASAANRLKGAEAQVAELSARLEVGGADECSQQQNS